MKNVENSCRLCANIYEEPALLQIFKNNASCADSIDRIINMYMPFKVTTNDNLPLKVCKMCSANVIKWHRFVQSCVKAQTKLTNKWRENDRSTSEKSCGNKEGNFHKTTDASPKSIQHVANDQTHLLVAVKSPVPRKKSTNYCIARWCNIGNETGISLFRIPKDKHRALQWLSLADRMDLVDKDITFLHRCYLCATHFTKEMFVNAYCKSLNHNAVPSIFPKPSYADRMEEDTIKASMYPKKLQGSRLKYLLPKVIPRPEKAVKGSSPDLGTRKHYTPVIAILKKPMEKCLEDEGNILGSIVQGDSNAHICNLPSGIDDESKSLLPFNNSNQENLLGDQCKGFSIVADLNSGCFPEIESSELPINVIKEDVGTGWSTKDQQELSKSLSNNDAYAPSPFFASQGHQDSTQAVHRNIVCDNSVVELADEKLEQQPQSGIPSTLMNLMNSDEPYIETDNVMMLELRQKSRNTGTVSSGSNPINFGCDQNETADSFSSRVTSSENSFSPLCSTQSFASRNSALLIHDGVAFGLKGALSEGDDSACLSNVVGSQDFLLMHSSSPQVEHSQEQRLRQNVNDLCCTIVSESVSEPIVYESRAMDAEVTARSMECTSPTHGQVIEGLIDLDQFLDST